MRDGGISYQVLSIDNDMRIETGMMTLCVIRIPGCRLEGVRKRRNKRLGMAKGETVGLVR